MPTYTTDWTFVEDGDSKVYNTDDLTGTDTSNITNAQVQWEGVDVTKEETNTTTNTNSSARTYTSGGDSVSVSYPSEGDPVRARGSVETDSDSNSYSNADVDLDSGCSVNSYTFDIDPPTDYSFTNSDTACNPSSASLTLWAGNNTYTIVVEAETEETTTTTTTYNTEDPSVSGDVSAGGPTSLNDGEQSAWYSMSGLDAGVDETFNFSINGSNDAYFRFEFDYDLPTASPTYGTYSVQYGGTWYEIAIADSSDAQLESDELQVYVNGNWGVLDFVPETYSDSYTVDHIRVWNGTEWLKARVYNTRPV